jgi:hypothetical protein
MWHERESQQQDAQQLPQPFYEAWDPNDFDDQMLDLDTLSQLQLSTPPPTDTTFHQPSRPTLMRKRRLSELSKKALGSVGDTQWLQSGPATNEQGHTSPGFSDSSEFDSHDHLGKDFSITSDHAVHVDCGQRSDTGNTRAPPLSVTVKESGSPIPKADVAQLRRLRQYRNDFSAIHINLLNLQDDCVVAPASADVELRAAESFHLRQLETPARPKKRRRLNDNGTSTYPTNEGGLLTPQSMPSRSPFDIPFALSGWSSN